MEAKHQVTDVVNEAQQLFVVNTTGERNAVVNEPIKPGHVRMNTS